MVLPDHLIRKYALEKKMIEPFAEASEKGVISYGLSSYGYDMRIGREFKLYRTQPGAALRDPKKTAVEDFTTIETDILELPGSSFCLAKSIEYFKIPRNVITVTTGKSTYARCGVLVNITPLEPEWEGHVTLQIFNTAPSPVKIYAEEGIAQVLFLESLHAPERSYADKGGKYQGSREITLAQIK
jgi:dCTP deaminase